MLKIIVCFLMPNLTLPFPAEIISTNRGFQSNLNMNRPRTIMTGSNRPRVNNYNNYNGYYNPYYNGCPHCYHQNPYYGYNQNLNELERYAFNRNYRRESNLQRLERLESLAFGAVQNGDIASRYRNVENAILSRPQNNYKRSVIGNIANYFAGQATGITPSIGDYASLGGFSTYPNPNYNNQRYEQYSNGIFGSGWGIQNQSFGNGTRVQILD